MVLCEDGCAGAMTVHGRSRGTRDGCWGVVDCNGRLFGVVWCFFGWEAVDAGFGGGGRGVAGCAALQ